MDEPAIRVSGLSKRYRLGELAAYATMRDYLGDRMGRGSDGRRARRGEALWALDDVSFTVDRGEVVAIVGRNGAGKTTLLKILSRITAPTRGRAEFRGRLVSLLEVGTGFHGELTGRENIFLNGAILGMSRNETARKFDEIVEFSGVGRFIDTPVKRFSSGMYVRLAFAVAAHLEPDILLVDEVLAVGDYEFQRKCLGKMETIGRSGRTVVFVSHNMPTVLRLCSRAILLENGALVADGPTEQVIGSYLTSESGTSALREWLDASSAPGDEYARLRSVRVVDTDLGTAETIDVRQPVGVELTFDVLGDEVPLRPQIMLTTDQGLHAFNAWDTDPRWNTPVAPGTYVSTAWIPPNLLNEGRMIVSVFLSTIASLKTTQRAMEMDAVAFQVVDPVEGDSAKGPWTGQWGGAVRPKLDWTTTGPDAAETPELPRSSDVLRQGAQP